MDTEFPLQRTHTHKHTHASARADTHRGTSVWRHSKGFELTLIN